jgi:hypothetical protein
MSFVRPAGYGREGTSAEGEAGPDAVDPSADLRLIPTVVMVADGGWRYCPDCLEDTQWEWEFTEADEWGRFVCRACGLETECEKGALL